MSTPVIPVLMGSINILQKPSDIMSYILAEYLSIPKNINDTFSNAEISFIYDAATFGFSPSDLSNAVQLNLITMLNKYFPNGNNTVEVDTKDVDGTRYNISIDMTVIANGTSYHIEKNFQTDPTGAITLNFIDD